jgi:hypothetical protein
MPAARSANKASCPASRRASCADFASDCARPTSSRGRTWRSATRAVMRSTSLQPLSSSRSACQRFCRSRAIASCRCRAWARSRRGSSIQHLSMRLPMPVMQVSNSEKRVGASSPRRVWTSSRLRRVVMGKSISSSSRRTCRLCTCDSARPCVCSAYVSRAEAAAWACPSSSAPQAASVALLSCSSSLRRPSPESNSHSGRCVSDSEPAKRSALSRCSNAGVTSAANNSSLGAMRATHVSSSSPVHSASCNAPCVTLSQARPSRCREPWCTASRMASALSLSNSVSVSVPGVTTRTTLRSTGPLAVATSPTCSQIATDSPCRIKRAR